jgi:hypothetical protein
VFKSIKCSCIILQNDWFISRSLSFSAMKVEVRVRQTKVMKTLNMYG